jgi:hypothetical protein
MRIVVLGNSGNLQDIHEQTSGSIQDQKKDAEGVGGYTASSRGGYRPAVVKDEADGGWSQNATGLVEWKRIGWSPGSGQ